MSTSPLAQSRHRRQQELWARTAAVAGRLNRAQAELVDIAAELIEDRHWGDGGFKTPEHYLVVRAGLSPAHAGDVVRVARRRSELVEASAALGAGELSLDQVAVIARAVPAGYQASVTALAREATVPQLRRAVARHAFPATPAPADTSDDPTTGDSVPVDDSTALAGLPLVPAETRSVSEQRACAKPELSMHYDADGRFQLRYSAPATIGALVEQAVKEAKDALFVRRRDAAAADTVVDHVAVDDRHSGLPTYADALEEMADRSLASVTST